MINRQPIIAGVAQITQRVDDPLDGREALLLIRDAVAAAAQDAGNTALPGHANSFRVPQGLWQYNNPAAWLREHFEATHAETMSAEISGTSVLSMLHDGARQVLSGQHDVVIIAGGETEHSNRRARRAGIELPQTTCDGPEPDRTFRASGSHHNGDRDAGFRDAPTIFALFETALRHARRESVPDHARRIAQLWAGFAEVARDNPHAWLRSAPDADTIATPGTDNRWVVNPYTKLMVSNMVVDQAAAVILTCPEVATRLGIHPSRWVYLHAGAEAAVDRPLSLRVSYADEPPMRLTGQRALELANIGVEALTHVDLYSCFPAAVQLGATALGLDPARPLTVTGGLTFHGGPFNSYVLHALASMSDRLRADAGALGLVSGVGGMFSKHAHCVLGTQPPAAGFRHADLAADVAALPQRGYVADHVGPVEIESCAVIHDDASGPHRALIAALTDDGRRTWAHTTDAGLMAQLAAHDMVGQAAARRADGTLDPG